MEGMTFELAIMIAATALFALANVLQCFGA